MTRVVGRQNDTGRTPAGPPADEVRTERVLVEQVLGERAVWPVLQPVVELETGAPAGYEALARGPAEHALHRPDALFAAARRSGCLAELDALCWQRALDSAEEAGLGPPTALFVNVEPEAIGAASDLSPTPAAYPALARLRGHGVHVIVELTERALAKDPARLLAFADRIRALGCGIALDDLGADPASLALMPLLQPDVIKLDLRLVQDRPDMTIAQTMTAVTAYAEAEDAVIVAEGVETERHEATARSLGATHGQGWLYGHPASPQQGSFTRSMLWRPIVPQPHRPCVVRESVFALTARGRTPLRGTKQLLIEVGLHVERQAAALGSQAVVLATFEQARHFGPTARARFVALAEHAALVAVLGAGLTPEPAPGVRGADLDPDDPVRNEWALVVVGPHFAVALTARDHGDTGPELDRRFDYLLTYDRHVVLEAARSLLGRVGPAHLSRS